MIEFPTSTPGGYEALRTHALGEPSQGGGARGFAVFVRRGMLAWCLLWARATSGTASLQLAAERATRRSPLPVALDGSVVQILASMVLASRSEVSEHV